MYELAIITPVFNNIEDTTVFIKHIAKFTKSDFQLIIIDNGSSDGTTEFLLKFEDDPRIKLIFNKTNRGYGHANNQGIEQANSEFSCFINNDVLLYDGWDQDLIRPLNFSDKIGASGPITNNCAGTQCDLYGLKNITTGTYKFKQAEIKAKNLNNYKETNRIIGFCFMTKLDLIKKINGFDEKYNVGNFVINGSIIL